MAASLSCASVMAQESANATEISSSDNYLPQDSVPYYQAQRNTLQISVGLFSGFWAVKQLFAWIPAAAGHSREWNYYGNYGLQYYYQLNWYCRVGGKLNWEIDAYDIYESSDADAKKKGVTRNNTVSLVASVQFTYFNRPRVQVYSGADVGVGVHFANTRYEPGFSGSDGEAVWLPALNITPVGVAFGSWPVYGYVETNLGYDAILKAGLGCHF